MTTTNHPLGPNPSSFVPSKQCTHPHHEQKFLQENAVGNGTKSFIKTQIYDMHVFLYPLSGSPGHRWRSSLSSRTCPCQPSLMTWLSCIYCMVVLKTILLHNFPWQQGQNGRSVVPQTFLSSFHVERHHIC